MDTFIVSVEIIVAREDRFLTIVRSDDEDFGGGWLCFPAGKLDYGETEENALENTACRELLEEVGLTVDASSLTYVESHTFNVGDQPVLDAIFLAHDSKGEPSIQDPAEVAEILWLTEDEIMADPRVQPWTRESLRRAVRHIRISRHESTGPGTFV